jgi:hypothetical protein
MTYAPGHEKELSDRSLRRRVGVHRASRSASQRTTGEPRPREILDAIFYVLKSGCPWRLLPQDFPTWETDRLAGVHATARVRGFASQVGGGKDLFVAWSKQEDEQGLREAVRQRGGFRLRGDDPADGEEVGSCLRLSKQFLHALR